MIARVLEQQNALSKVLSADRKVRHLLPSWQDLEILEYVNKALSPLQDFTDALSGERYVSVSCVKPTLHLLNTSVLAEEEEDTNLTKSLKSKILAYLNKKYEDSVTQELLNMSSFLDPRFRTQHISEQETQTLKEQVITELIDIHQQQPVAQSTAAMEDNPELDAENPPAAKAKKKTLASFFKKTTSTTSAASFDPMVQFREAVAAELNAYINMPCVDHEEDPQKWTVAPVRRGIEMMVREAQQQEADPSNEPPGVSLYLKQCALMFCSGDIPHQSHATQELVGP
ncbi:zinc finger BED domain-containing 1-like protein [Labeo rohita]|uniref:Zinc finger BED domain-containing 1-like protein n=1 Tax=Labeo rohita TaxID=84645 RepID=A0A498MX53_LABRO|nr:zinc finger BED domain-containing 1-like protein [Labeo rohita]